MPRAIHTRYIPQTDTKGAKVKATVRIAHDLTVSVTIPYSWSGREHQEAAEALRDRHYPGASLMLVGQALDGRGDVYAIDPINV